MTAARCSSASAAPSATPRRGRRALAASTPCASTSPAAAAPDLEPLPRQAVPQVADRVTGERDGELLLVAVVGERFGAGHRRRGGGIDGLVAPVARGEHLLALGGAARRVGHARER